MIQVDRLTVVRQGRTILSDVRLSLSRGEVLVVAGPSGSGKSTLLRALSGLDVPAAGTVKVAGHVVSEGRRSLIASERRNIAMVFQDLALWPHMTVRGNLEFGLKARGCRSAEREERIQQAVCWVNLEDKLDRLPGELSGGERQRVAVARALVLDPQAILFDEPLANLDVALKQEILSVLCRVLEERKLTAIYVTHDPREAQRFGGKVAVLENGRITQLGTLRELAANPATPFVRVFATSA